MADVHEVIFAAWVVCIACAVAIGWYAGRDG